jgi:hypothetical protein
MAASVNERTICRGTQLKPIHDESRHASFDLQPGKLPCNGAPSVRSSWLGEYEAMWNCFSLREFVSWRFHDGSQDWAATSVSRAANCNGF